MKQLILALMFLCMVSVAQAQVLYLSPRIGDGTEPNPYRAYQSGSYKDCSPLGTYFICEGPSVPNETGVVELPRGDGARLTARQKTALGTVTGRVAKETVAELAWDLADISGNVYAKDKSGLQHIGIRGRDLAVRSAPLTSYIPDVLRAVARVFSTSVAWAASSLTETFTCADTSTSPFACDHTWTRNGGSVAAIVSNTLRTVNSSLTQVVSNGSILDSGDMLHRITVTEISRASATNRAGGPGIRYQTSTNYLFCLLRDAATDEVVLGQVVANVLTELSTVSATVSNGDTIEARGVGDQISCRHNSALVLGPTTNTNFQTEDNVNVRFSGSGSDAAALVVLDDSFASNTIPSDILFGPLRRRAGL